jgi:hypothetical protein
MIAGYYLWKWADNDLPGKPLDVFASLLCGEIHPALRTFDARPLLDRLGLFAALRRLRGEDWYCESNPTGHAACARFVFLAGPTLDESRERVTWFAKAVEGLEISGYDEQTGHVIHALPPKINCMHDGQHKQQRNYDVTTEEVPALIQQIDPHEDNPFAVLADRHHNFVQCYADGDRYCVEWRENKYRRDDSDFRHWRASLITPADDVTPNRWETAEANTVPFADSVAIFQSFIRGDPKPGRYHWRDIRSLLHQEPATQTRHRKEITHEP